MDVHEGLLARIAGPWAATYRLRHVRNLEQASRELTAAAAAEDPFALAFVDLDAMVELGAVEAIEHLHATQPDLEIVGTTAASCDYERLIFPLTAPAQVVVVRAPTDPTVLRQLAISLVEKWRRGRLLADRVASLEAQIAAEVTARMQVETERTHKFDALGRLAAGIAHEINTPIQYLRSSLEFLGAALPQVLEERALRAGGGEVAVDPEIDELVAEIPLALADANDGVDRVAKIIRGVQNYAHPSATDKTAVDINRQILIMVELARNEYKQDADLVLALGEVPAVQGQPDALGCAILNLLINAAQAVREVRRERTGRGTITIATRVEAGYVVVSISDTGPGIPEIHRERVFSPFFTTKAVGQGTGQGLAIARATIVDGHRGRLTFESELGRGTTFHVGLPIAAEDRR